MTSKEIVIVSIMFLVDNAPVIVNAIRNMYKIYKNNRSQHQG